MSMIGVESHNFHFDFFEKNKIPFFFNKVPHVPSMYCPGTNAGTESKSVHILNCVLPYIIDDTCEIAPQFGYFSKTYRLGFAMDFSKNESQRDYLRNRLGKKMFKNLRQDQQRLEKSFDITFKIYHGDIQKENCGFLMTTLKTYIESRFEGRVHKHVALEKWDFYKNSSYGDIISKKASLFVMYNGNNPIAISLNYHYKNILNAAITSFDQDYYRYSLGKLMFAKQIDWCYANKYVLLDTGWGSLEYKIKFSNAVYRYQTMVLYPKNNIPKMFLAFTISWLLMAKYYLVMLRDKRLKKPEVTYANRWLDPKGFNKEVSIQ